MTFNFLSKFSLLFIMMWSYYRCKASKLEISIAHSKSVYRRRKCCHCLCFCVIDFFVCVCVCVCRKETESLVICFANANNNQQQVRRNFVRHIIAFRAACQDHLCYLGFTKKKEISKVPLGFCFGNVHFPGKFVFDETVF